MPGPPFNINDRFPESGRMIKKNNRLVNVADVPDVDLPVNTPITLCARSISGNATVTSVFRAREEWQWQAIRT